MKYHRSKITKMNLAEGNASLGWTDGGSTPPDSPANGTPCLYASSDKAKWIELMKLTYGGMHNKLQLK